jgi:hypothetical protein
MPRLQKEDGRADLIAFGIFAIKSTLKKGHRTAINSIKSTHIKKGERLKRPTYKLKSFNESSICSAVIPIYSKVMAG